MAATQPINISQDHIVKIQPNEDVVLALDPDTGKELCKFSFEVDGKNVYFKTPTWGKYDKFALKLAQLFIYLSQYAPNLEKPDDSTNLYNNPDDNPIWKKLSAIAATSRPIVKKLVLDIFFNYLDGYIEGIQPKRQYFFNKSSSFAKAQIRWFEEHARIDDVQRVFAACLAVDDLIKKNATIVLEKKMGNIQHSQAKSCGDILQMKQESTSKDSTPTQSSTLERL